MNDFNPPIGSVMPFTAFPVQSDCDRVVLPVYNVVRVGVEVQRFWDAENQVVISDPPLFVMATFDRTPNGWRRIK